MKIPASSSILLATVAISSSSSCLAAPAGTMTTSTSTSHISAPTATATSDYHPSERIVQEGSDVSLERGEYSSSVDKRDLLPGLGQVVGSIPVLGQPLVNALSPILAVQAGAQSNDTSASGPNLNPQDMAALQASVQEVTRVLNASLPLPVSQPIQGAEGAPASALPIEGVMSAGDDTNSNAASSGSIPSGTPGPTQAAQAVDGQSSAGSTTASATPSSPPMPGNPPNTPTPSVPLPVGNQNSGGLPVNV